MKISVIRAKVNGLKRAFLLRVRNLLRDTVDASRSNLIQPSIQVPNPSLIRQDTRYILSTRRRSTLSTRPTVDQTLPDMTAISFNLTTSIE